jgi:murein L,D-transpeptidase YafK
MMMTRAWLILADILVHLLLFISLIFFYLNPPSYTHLKKVIQKPKKYCPDPYILSGTLPLPGLDLNATMTLEDLRRMGEQCSVEEYHIEKNIFLKDTLEERLAALSVKIGNPIFIRLFKEEAMLEVWIKTGTEYTHLKDYIICASSGHLGPKLKEGDKQSPEGFYKVQKHQLNPHSKFHLSFNLGYPNRYDRAYGRTGSFLMVHGNCVSVGCYAMTDEKIEEIYALVKSALKHGQNYVDVHAFPFRMTEENMNLYEGNRWYDFWMNLKEGYDYFESEKLPPKIKVEAKRYEIYEP